MLADSMCDCVCGKHNWRGGGGYCGPGKVYTWFKCKSCDSEAMVFEAPYMLVLMSCYAADITDYTNNILMSAWREAEEAKNDDPMPPRIPDGIRAFKRVRGSWVEVDHATSNDMPAPIDPTRTKHDMRWAEMLEHLGIKDKVKEIPNRYYDDHLNNEPWFEYVSDDGAKWIFGPRKRVLSITVTRDEAFRVDMIAARAKEDGVSYWAANGWHDWTAIFSNEMTVHARTKEKFYEYFKLTKLGLRGLGIKGPEIQGRVSEQER